jgi:hypothetical protein
VVRQRRTVFDNRIVFGFSSVECVLSMC